jgi:hypothetical protein
MRTLRVILVLGAHAPGLLLAKDTPVPLLFAAAVSSRTAEVGDKIPMTPKT